MARWEPDARARLATAAMELFQERGYAGTTVAEIAAHAGLTERTFFRHFADKREVLFSGSEALQTALVDLIASAPADEPPLATVGRAFEAAATRLQEMRDLDQVRARHALLALHAELRERELIKMATLATAVTDALRARRVPEPAASLAAESGVAVFKVAFERWVAGSKPRDFAGHVRAAMRALATLVDATR